MCGRFALGLNADELVDNVNAHYFHPEQDTGPGEDGGDEQGGQQPEGNERVVWGPLEDKMGHRVRYNVSSTFLSLHADAFRSSHASSWASPRFSR
jgi:hypothetical protein